MTKTLRKFKRGLKPLDIVRMNDGSVALVTTVNNNGKASVDYIVGRGKSAWWELHEVQIVNTLPRVLSLSCGDTRVCGAREAAKNAYKI